MKPSNSLRRLIAILFLSVLVFNFYGYRLMIDYMEDRHTVVLESRLDKEQYNEDELISIKTPLSLPYYSPSPAWERAYGSVEVDGIIYEYVKRRVHQDTLELLCLPDKTKMQLQSVKHEYFRLSLDGNQTQGEKKSHAVKISLPDFFQVLDTYVLATLQTNAQQYFPSYTSFVKVEFTAKEEHPPESMQLLM